MSTKEQLTKQKKRVEKEIRSFERDVSTNNQAIATNRRILKSGRGPKGPLTSNDRRWYEADLAQCLTEVEADTAALNILRARLTKIQKRLDAL